MLAIHFKFLVLIWLPVKAGYIVLVEEYLPAIVADYIYIARVNGHLSRGVKAIISHVFSYVSRLAALVPFISVYLNADNSVVRKQWKLRRTLDEKIEYISMQRKTLPTLAMSLSQNVVYIDTSNGTIEEVNHDIKKCLIELLGL